MVNMLLHYIITNLSQREKTLKNWDGMKNNREQQYLYIFACIYSDEYANMFSYVKHTKLKMCMHVYIFLIDNFKPL